MKVIKYDSLASVLSELISQKDAAETATTNAENASTQAGAALADILATTDIDGDYISYTIGEEPDSSGASSGTIGAYFKEDGVFQKVEWDGSGWVEIGEPIVSRKYVDDKASLSGSRVSVLDFGAVGDGVANDSEAIQSAIDSGAKIIQLPKGDYRIVNSLLMGEGQTLLGEGHLTYDTNAGHESASVISNKGFASEGAYDAEGNITIRDIRISANGSNGIVMAHASGIVIQGVRFTDWRAHMVDLIGCRDSIVTGCIGENDLTGNGGGSAIQVDTAQSGAGSIYADGVVSVFTDDTPCEGVIIANNLVKKNAQSYGGHVHRTGHKNITFCDNIFLNVRSGVFVDSNTDNESITVKGNQILLTNELSNGLDGISIGGEINGLQVEGNSVTGEFVASRIGIHLGDGPYTNVVISGNIIKGAGVGFIRINECENFSVTGNVGDSLLNATQRRGIHIHECSNGSVSGNSISADSVDQFFPGIWIVRGGSDTNVSRNIAITGNAITGPDYGIAIRNRSEGISITGNVLRDIQDRGIYAHRQAAGQLHKSLSITGNTIIESRSAISIEHPEQCSVVGNTIRTLATSPDGAIARGVQLVAAVASLVSANNINGVNHEGTGILLADSPENVIVTSNIVTGMDAAKGSSGTPGTIEEDNNIYFGNNSTGSF